MDNAEKATGMNRGAAGRGACGLVTLHQDADVVVRLEFAHFDEHGIHRTKGTGDINLGESETVDPGYYGVPDGAEFSLYLFVAWGDNIEGNERLVYQRGSSRTADFTTKGTTPDVSLMFLGID